ncbi:type II secretion system protein [Vibrio echinoideorum]|uniref:type II secretion system protein n=1 Tax=Vibrio echinoideorum TaxID=2100116 RepID=UPI003551005A
MHKNQRGFTLIELSMVIVILSFIMLGLFKYNDVLQKNVDRDGFVEVLGHMIESAQGWQLEYVKKHDLAWLSYNNTEIWDTWPDSLDALIDSPHYTFSSCSKAQEVQERCLRGDAVYWSGRHVTQQKAINPHTLGYAYYFIIPLAELAPGGSAGNQDWAQYNQILSPLLKRGAERLTNNDVRIEVPVLQDAFAYSDMVWRNGSKTLTADWDIGGDYGITNAKDYLIAASDGSQISVSKRLVTIEAVAHSQSIRKPTCSKGLSPALMLNFSEVPTDYAYDSLVSFKAYIQNQTSSAWTVGIDTVARNVNTKKLEKIHMGKATALVRCI